jgi:hypothetical protein
MQAANCLQNARVQRHPTCWCEARQLGERQEAHQALNTFIYFALALQNTVKVFVFKKIFVE